MPRSKLDQDKKNLPDFSSRRKKNRRFSLPGLSILQHVVLDEYPDNDAQIRASVLLLRVFKRYVHPVSINGVVHQANTRESLPTVFERSEPFWDLVNRDNRWEKRFSVCQNVLITFVNTSSR